MRRDRCIVTVVTALLVPGCGGGGAGHGALGDAGDGADARVDGGGDGSGDGGADAGGGAGDEDGDGDGFTNAEEVACGGDPDDAAVTCYACGWARGDPGDLVATGASVGDTIEDLALIDACGEQVPLWDFAGSYRIAWMTTGW